ncbi:35634_t:CDS:2, partial [Gigaspora margarita]
MQSEIYSSMEDPEILDAITHVNDKKLCAPLPSPPPSPFCLRISFSNGITSPSVNVNIESISLTDVADFFYSEITNLLNMDGLRTDIILDLINSNEITITDVFNRLLNNQAKIEYLGLLYYYYSPTSQDYDKALCLFFSAANDYDSVAQNYI